MNLTMAIVYGAIGGSLRGLLAMYGHIERWLEVRREQHGRRRRRTPARFSRSADWPAEIVGTAVQVLMAVVTAVILYGTGTVTTVVGLILGGAAAPAILAQLGQLRVVSQAVIGPVVTTQIPVDGDNRGRGSAAEPSRSLASVSGGIPEARSGGEFDQEMGDV
ncbi:hypothetical protein [Actinophytocola xanthii]|uniref:Uncharacterized protein n=1 Tax=Actinophytocola xanthii TaxID=1912961 RepID=A0A1Q8CUW3_9PSEU|nr:hypothetical protein [Actinophytocola xanthii]OLF18147.1 hypothetical protein BU204_08450 [Actinophytocola xanthii]